MQGVEKIVENFQPLTLARWLCREAWESQGGRATLWGWQGDVWEWYGEKQWVRREPEWLVKQCLLRLEGVGVRTEREGGFTVKMLEVTPQVARDVAFCVMALREFPYPDAPRWLEAGAGLPDPRYLVVFQDKVVDVKGSAERGELVVLEKDERLFATAGLSVPFVEGAGCEVWERCCEQWHQGKREPVEARERFYGMACMGAREWPKVLLEYGRERAGKGSGTNFVMRPLLGAAYFGTSLDGLARETGLEGAESAAMMVVGEAEGEGQAVWRRVGGLWKRLVGRDQVTFRRLYKKQWQGVLPGALVVQCNDMTELPEVYKSISSKLVPVRFPVSFAGREDGGLEWRLRAELPGIAMRLVKAAVRLVAERDASKWFPLGVEERELLDHVSRRGDVQEFLEWGFVENSEGFVHGELVRERWREWEREEGRVLRDAKGRPMNDRDLLGALEEGARWNLARARDEGGEKRVRGLKGLSLRARGGGE